MVGGSRSLVPGVPNSHFFFLWRICISLALRAYLVRISDHGCIFIERSADWMVDEVVVVVFTINIHSKYVDWPLCVTTFFLCMKEASKVNHSASYVVGCWWLLAAVFVSAASTLRLLAFEAGGILSE